LLKPLQQIMLIHFLVDLQLQVQRQDR